ncbi:MAG: HNH endonuclease [Chloroflexi bacterium]|nr:HNH endonuclease [Chloroflexota bacterium]
MIKPGEVISYLDMCKEEGANLQRGMNFHFRRTRVSVILMSVRRGAPYSDRVEEEGKVLIYEGHDAPRTKNGPNPKTTDQPMKNPSGGLTENGKFFNAAMHYKGLGSEPELVRVYEKIHAGIWAYSGVFKLVDAWQEVSDNRKVFKFRLELADSKSVSGNETLPELDYTRIIPTAVKLEVWKRDKGRCVKCGSTNNLHVDHIIPYSMGGSSLVAENIQLLCAKHNLGKSDNLE